MKIGVHVGMAYTSPKELADVACRVEQLGFDWISIYDHLYASNGSRDRHCLEASTIHTLLATATKRIRVGCLVYVAAYRPPATLAKTLATMDHISDGRITAGLGAGWNGREFQSFGFPFRPAGERADQLEEYARVLTGLLHGRDPLTFDGRYYRTVEATCDPHPVQDRLPIWIGGTGERRTLPLVAELADGWNAPFLSPDEFARKRKRLAELCAGYDRDISGVLCSANIGLAWTEESLVGQFGRYHDKVRDAVLTGSVAQMQDLVGRYGEAGADQVNIAVRGARDSLAGRQAYRLEEFARLADTVLAVPAIPN